MKVMQIFFSSLLLILADGCESLPWSGSTEVGEKIKLASYQNRTNETIIIQMISPDKGEILFTKAVHPDELWPAYSSSNKSQESELYTYLSTLDRCTTDKGGELSYSIVFRSLTKPQRCLNYIGNIIDMQFDPRCWESYRESEEIRQYDSVVRSYRYIFKIEQIYFIDAPLCQDTVNFMNI